MFFFKGTGHVAVAMRSEIKNFCWCICPMPRYIHTCMLFFLIPFILCFSYRWKIEYKKTKYKILEHRLYFTVFPTPPKKKWMRNQNVYMYVFQSDKVKYYTVLQTKYGPFVVFFSSDKQQYPKKTDSQRTFALCKCLRAYTRKMMMMSFKETLKQYWMDVYIHRLDGM